MKTILLFIGFLVIRAIGVKVGLELIPPDIIEQMIGELDINTLVTGYVTGSAIHRNPHRAGKAAVEKHIPHVVTNLKNLLGR